MYVVMPEGGGLTPVNAGDVYYLSEYGSRICFYIGLQPGYQNLEVWGDGIVTVPELTQDTDAPGAGEAYEAGCSLWMSSVSWMNSMPECRLSAGYGDLVEDTFRPCYGHTVVCYRDPLPFCFPDSVEDIFPVEHTGSAMDDQIVS